MAAKTQITNKGLELMASSSKATGQHWWLGWYALAYVPDEMQEEKDEKLSPSMTKLTKDGDIIYNIFQGDMNGDGYQTTKASAKFKSVNYDSNIKKNYRYVLDDDGRNNLVTFVDGKHGLKGAYIYKGVQVIPSRDDTEIGHENSTIPLPAPLLYTGVKAAGEGWNDDSIAVFLGSGNESIEKFYPVEEVMVDGEKRNVPRVSTDFRNYEGYKNGLPLIDSDDAYEFGLETITQEKVDFDGWFPSVNTYTQNDETDMGEDYNQYCYQYWKVLSISNFNKYCAPVNASGLLYDENTGCRNMAKATKYFPISDYSVTSTAKTKNNEYATGIKLRVQLKLNGNAEDGAYFKEVETGSTGNVATLNPEPTEEEQALFNTQKVSFKFNRIGIYAVPMRQYGCSDDSGDMKAQYQIDTEAEPVLFAVCEWDSPVTLSDSGDGLSEFQSDIFIDLSAAVEDSSVIRESAVFYNLYEDDAIDWYKNQLVANASMAEALVNMQIEMGYLLNQKNAKAGCCPKQEAIQQKEKSVTGLRNLVDAMDYNSNSVRNRLAAEEGVHMDAAYSDKIPQFSGIGYPHVNSANDAKIYARKTTIVHEAEPEPEIEELYSVLFGAVGGMSAAPYSDAVIDGNTYINLAPNEYTEGRTYATRIGGMWVRTELYYELYSLIQPSSQSNNMTYDYPDDADTNGFINGTGPVEDYFGTDTEGRGYSGEVTITKTASGITNTDNGTTTSGFPAYWNASAVPELDAEINRSFENYETKREYTVKYMGYSSSRDYTGYAAKRTVTLKLPKIQLYGLSSDVYAAVNKQLSSTGWRIPTTADWNEIISKSTAESIKKIRSNTKWDVSDGTGGVYPLGGVTTGRAGTSLDTSSKVIYLAIADDTTNVVAFDGTSFKIVGKSFPERETGLSYVAILCVTDAIKVSDEIPTYKLGYDSYALMEGSVSAGEHNFNAGVNSSIFPSALYNSIFGGMNNTISNSSHNTILNGYNNELLGAVFSTVGGINNLLQRNEKNEDVCRTLLLAINSVAAGCTTSSIVAEESEINGAKISSILGYDLNVNLPKVNSINTLCWLSRVTGQNSEIDREVQYSDLLVNSAYHIPKLYMSRAAVANDRLSSFPSALKYGLPLVNCSNFIGYNAYFLEKETENPADYEAHTVFCSHLVANDSGIIKAHIVQSDVFTQGYNTSVDWFKYKTLESVSIYASSVKLNYSSIASNYIEDDVSRGSVAFSDIALSSSLMLLTKGNGSENTKTVSYGVIRLANSNINLCNCSYLYESGDQHYLNNSDIKHATLVGKLLSLSSGTYQNTHIYGSLSLSASLSNHIILSGLDGTNVGNGHSASSYISEFGSDIVSNDHGYPMIWSLGGIGLFMNKMILGNKGVSSSKAPSVGDVLTVVGVEGNIATVAWMPGGSAGSFGTFHLELVFSYGNSQDDKHWGDRDDYAKNPWANLHGYTGCIDVNGHDIPKTSASLVNTMNTYMSDDIKFVEEGGLLKLVNNSSSDSYMINGTARCELVNNTLNPPTGYGSSNGWQMWDTVGFQPYALGTYAASLSQITVAAGAKYDDLVRSLAFGNNDTEQYHDLCSVEVESGQELICKWVVDITYRKV